MTIRQIWFIYATCKDFFEIPICLIISAWIKTMIANKIRLGNKNSKSKKPRFLIKSKNSGVVFALMKAIKIINSNKKINMIPAMNTEFRTNLLKLIFFIVP